MELKKLAAKLKTDPQLELDGVEVEIGEGFFVKVARVGNKRYAQMLRQLGKSGDLKKAFDSMKANEDLQMEPAEADTAAVRAVYRKLKAATILVGWRGLTEGDQEVAYTPARAEKLLEMFPELEARIDSVSVSAETYLIRSVDASITLLGNA